MSLGRYDSDLAVAIDECRQAGVDGSSQRHPVFDRPEYADGQVHVELGGAVEPAVVGQVDRAHRAARPPAASSKKRAITWGTVSSKQIVTASRYSLKGMSRGSRPKLRLRHSSAVIRRQDRQPGHDVDERDVLSKRDQMHLVIKVDLGRPRD